MANSASSSQPLDLVKTVVIALLIAVGLRTFLFQPFTVPSDSMEPMLQVGDYMVVSKFDYGFSRHSAPISLPGPGGRWLGHAPQRGDVIVFKLPRDNHTDYVKRLIGLPGDRIRVSHGVVFVNDQPASQRPVDMERDADDPGRIVTLLQETLPGGVTHAIYRVDTDHEGENTGDYVVPAGQYFMMGDNRDNSADSRWPPQIGVGFVPAENLEGKVRVILVSWKPGAGLLKPWTWLSVKPDRLFRPVG